MARSRWKWSDSDEIEPETAAAGIESYHHLYSWRAHNPDRLPDNCVYIGIAGDLIMSQPNTNLLVLGPSQGVGKTSGNVVAQVLCARGPVIVTSSKGDIIAPLVMARALVGTVWFYSLDGDAVPPGMNELRYSPVPMCRDWGTAQLTATAIVKSSKEPGQASSDTNAFFDDQAAFTLACFLFYAARLGHDMAWVVSMINNPRDGGDGQPWGMAEMLAVLEERGHEDVADALAGLANAPDRQRASVFATASRALRAYSLPSVLATTKDPNFSIDAFVAGQPEAEQESMNWDGDCQLEGAYDTVFITAAEQTLVMGPVVAAFLAQARSRRRKLFRADTDPDRPGLAHRPPLTFMLDELATMAPIYDLPDQLAIGNEGMVTVGVLQDISQAKRIWGAELGKGLLTLFQNVLIFRGIRDSETLQAISAIAGQAWIEVQGSNQGTSSSGLFDPVTQSSGMSVTQQLVPALPLDAIVQGHPQHPDAVLWLRPDGSHQWVHNAPYYRARPWVPILVQTMEDIARLPLDDPRRLLRVPNLFDGYVGHTFGLGHWEQRYWNARQQLDRTRRSILGRNAAEMGASQ
ncbi:type IV secretory system conjugative DNA transfer family protein [Blastococcus sp. TF02A-26]|uniref:type IV secretory system conjugative DNA transfer family protein n=1 Tax=Blastococcus sp. TF02A-26 TaxID=2250577 RepID=UPI0013141C3D|nr:TraM recognition domain-containing protein [Blastococcus sp. TF02A-26]